MSKWEHLIDDGGDKLRQIQAEYSSHKSPVTEARLTWALNEADTRLRAAERAFKAANTYQSLEAYIREAKRSGDTKLAKHLGIVYELLGDFTEEEITQMETSTTPNRVNTIAMNASGVTTLYHRTDTNVDRTPQRWRVTGKVKFWKTRPTHFKIPVKRGMREYGYVTHENAEQFSTDENEASRGNQNF